MNKKNNSLKLFFIVSSLFLSFCCSLQLSYADFYVIAGGGRMAGTEIKSLPYTISTPGFYYITKNLWSPPETHGLTIEADNVTLDLMGFSIGLLALPGVPAGYDGIHMNGRTNVEIRNGTVTGFHRHGIHEASQTGVGHRIINVRSVSNRFYGIKLDSIGNLIKGCLVYANGNGISTGDGSTITGNNAIENLGHGISTGVGSTVTGNIARGHYFYGIGTNSGSTVIGNTAYENGTSGIYGGIGSTVTGNNCYKNGVYGIILYDGNSTINSNTAYLNGDTGIYSGGDSTLTGNTAYGNGSHGIYAGQRSAVIGNTAIENKGMGIYLVGLCLYDQNSALGNIEGNIYRYAPSNVARRNYAP